ncbi:phosphopeptide-binding protein [Streptomyces sp. MUSC 125]|uniref:FHA domain-containing protein n=1 Tax=Streptomyces sp. MUSC 125 TaxID=1428624 RepID=UPI00057F3293|nr:FHA domain-containing protein [Streptomyces sp. MUSC 125]KIE28044.1 phosphopeptide-binding protein [Streptomyces sp. MUSC 125]
MPTCPNGHQSGSDDWCEVCGHRMAGAVPPPPPPAGGYGFPPPTGQSRPGSQAGGGHPHPSGTPGSEPELCPQCRTPREGGAPFCEECRWNFLTNTATSYTPAAPTRQARFQPPSATYGSGDGYEYRDSRPSQINRPAEPIPSFGSEPSGPMPFGGDRGRSGPPTSPGPSGPDGPTAPPAFGGERRPSGPPRDFGGSQVAGRVPGQGPASDGLSGFGGSQPQGAGGPSGSPFFGGGQRQGQGQGQRPDGSSGPPPFSREPSAPDGPTPPGPSRGPGAPGPSGFGVDPSRPVPPSAPSSSAGRPPGPGAGPGGAPQAFQSAPSAPPAFPQETGRPPVGGPPGGSPFGGPSAGGPSFGGGEDDWVISPPTSAGPSGGPGSPDGGRPGGQGGGYGYPPPGGLQGPSGPGFPQPSQQATWTATIGPDREYFMAMMQRSGPEAAGLNLPAYSPEQQRTLAGNQITIGRRRHSTGDTPDIDLAVPPEDPGVSHQHAVLVQQPDGSWAIVDQNSTNGTTVNGAEEPIQPFVPVPLQDGDRVHVGAWTTITIRRA